MKYLFAAISVICIALLAAFFAVRKTTPVAEAPASTPVATSSAALSELASSTQVGWKTYTNLQQGYQLDVPESWVIGEYELDSSRGIVTALDPVAVISEEDYRTLDLAPGRFWITPSPEGDYRIGVTTTREIGVQKNVAYYDKHTTFTDGPNPFWYNKTKEAYFSPGSAFPFTIEFYYPNEEGTDASAQAELKRMVDSFRLF